MKIILSKRCESLTGTLGKELGYHIQHRKYGFFSKRNSNGHVPPDGHWMMIRLCAYMALQRLCITDILVSGYEMKAALLEAEYFASAQWVDVDEVYNAEDVLNFIEKCKI